MDVRGYNREDWDNQVESGNQWTVPVAPDFVGAARQCSGRATRAIKP
jgi:hypothetical protein